MHLLENVWDACVVIVGGHDTGGFAQAPAVSAAILAAVRNEHHDMHVDYHAGRVGVMMGAQ